MTGQQHLTTPRLGEFLDALEARLLALNPEQVVAALMTHAGRLPARSRQGFLDIFPGADVTPTSGPANDHHRLLADIDAFAERARAGEFGGDPEDYVDPFDNDYWDDDVDTSWVEDADALFAAVGEVFLAGRLDLAREAYGHLLLLFRPDHHGGSDLEAWRLASTDVDEVAARYLRCVYETTPAAQRAETVYREYAGLGLGVDLRRLRLRDIGAARRGELPDLGTFLPAWIDALLGAADGPAHGPRQRLLTEAVLACGGISRLGELARRPGTHQAATYLDWIDALAGAGRTREAADAAREALTLPAPEPGPLAQAADRLASLAARLDDHTTAVEARGRAWRTEPTLTRLLALSTAADAAGTSSGTLAAEARHAHASTDRLSCALFLLAGQVDTAATALANTGPLGWSSPAHPGPVVVPYLLLAATATAPPPAAAGCLGQAFAAVDVALGWPAPAPLDHDPTDELHGIDQHTDGPGPDPLPESLPPSLTTLLARALTHRRPNLQQRQQWLAIAADAIEQRVDAIVGNKHRRAYARAAVLAVAYAETLAITHDNTRAGFDHIDDVRQRYPRHTAFRAELDAAVRTSTALAPTRGTSAGRAARQHPRRPRP